MSSAIEVLKRIKQDNYLTGVQLPAFSQDEANKKRIKSMRERDNALDEAIVALKQISKLKADVESLTRNWESANKIINAYNNQKNDRKQGALEEFVKIKQMYYRLDVNRFMEFLNQEKLRFEKELEGVEQ